jgi:hypothetical protein
MNGMKAHEPVTRVEKKGGTPKLAYARREDRFHLDTSASKICLRATTL